MKEQLISDQGRGVSHKTDFPWPPQSPDLNPLDFIFGVLQKRKSVMGDPNPWISLSGLLKTLPGKYRERLCLRLLIIFQSWILPARSCGSFQHLLKKKKWNDGFNKMLNRSRIWWNKCNRNNFPSYKMSFKICKIIGTPCR